MKCYLLFNPLARSGKCLEAVNSHSLSKYGDLVFCDTTEISNMQSFISGLEPEDKVILCGGDGTLNHFINQVDTDNIGNDILFCAAGSGNDFINDLGLDTLGEPIKINDYIKNLPSVEVNGRVYKFINGIGYGMDGYVCQEVNRQRELKGKQVSYTPIAVKGLMWAFKPVNSTVIVDGAEYQYKKVWLVPSMKGKFFGGGMKIAPMQNRSNKEGTLSVIIAHDLSKLKITALFLTIFKGNHIKFKKHVTVLKGRDIKVVFDRPCPMQIDGETISDVLEYSVKVPVLVK